MKYLRLFENHEYYIEISWDEFRKAVFNWLGDIKGSDDILPFDKKEIDYLENICKIHNWKFSTLHRQALSSNEFSFGSRNDEVQVGIVVGGISERSIIIYKAVDEWYYVERFGGYLWYKCDQLEGVKKLIEKY